MTSQWQSVTPRDKPLPLHYIFGPELLSQTTLVKQENRVKEIYSLLYWTKMDTSTWNDDVRRQCLEVEITSIFLFFVFVWWTCYSQNFFQPSPEATGECQHFSTFDLIFICHSSSHNLGQRENQSLFFTEYIYLYNANFDIFG